jgi:IPT/TIG domain-containing protein/dockerin type I repeat protein
VSLVAKRLRHRVFSSLAGVCVMAGVGGVAQAQSTSYFGDVNGDGTIDAKDALAADQYLHNFVVLPADWVGRIDVDHNSVLDSRDSSMISIAATMQSGTALFNVPGSGNTVVTSMDPRYGPVGARLTIVGDGFRSGITTARLNGQPMNILDLQSSRLVVQVPSGAASGYVQVQVGQTTPSLLLDFVVGTLPRPSFPPVTLRNGDVGFLDGSWGSQIVNGRRVAVFLVPVAVRADPAALGAVQIQAIFDPNEIQCVSVSPSPGSPLGTTNFNYCIDNQHGDVGLVCFTDQAPQTPTGTDSQFVIATIVVRPTQPSGISSFVIGGISIVVCGSSLPYDSIAGTPHPLFMPSRRQRF